MIKTGIVLLNLIALHAAVMAQDSIQARIVLVGDAGQLTNGRHPVVSAVKNNVKIDDKTTFIFLGDNLYKTGLPDNSLPTFDIAKAPLDSQIHIAGKTNAKVYFVPGNHDWANGGTNGYQSILRVQSYIDYLGNKNVMMFPRDGCPGPEEVKITDDITLVMMDSQWWLHEHDKPGMESDCPTKTKSEVLLQLDDILSKNSQKLVLFAFHHPFRTYSPHGGYFTIRQHIFPFTDFKPNLYFPLPGIGSIYPLTRGVFGTEQDLKHPLYQEMISQIEPIVKGHPNVIYVNGHDHSIQLIQDSGYNYIVSGSGSKNSRVSKSKQSLYATALQGFVTLEVSKNKNVQAKVYTVEGDVVKMDYSSQILDFTKIPIPAPDTLRYPEYKFKDSVVISASDQYKAKPGFRTVILGNNYRKEWTTPITMREFNMRKEKGGFTIKSLGGGKQTKSLRLTDKNGTEWTLRTVDKDPEKIIPVNLRGTMAQAIVQDMISTGHPYAPLVVKDLAVAAGVITPDPEFFFVPDDPAFGEYRPLFANTVAMLENREPGSGFVETRSTAKVMNKMLEDNDHHIDQEKVLNARLLDFLVGDWDRHWDQWRWGTGDTGKGKLYYPIPRDRDQAFFNSDGLLIWYVSRRIIPFMQGFKKKIRDINGFNWEMRDFDRFFMNNLDEPTWDSITRNFQTKFPDSVIYKAVKKFPAPIAAMDSQVVAAKLISRRDDMFRPSKIYYRFLSKMVSYPGSNKSEYFHIRKHPLGLHLTVYKKNSSSDSATIMYNRIFDDKITKEIRLFGLNGNDKFEIDEDVSSKIKLRIIGGKGSDTFNLKGDIQNIVYDLTSEKNASINLRRTRAKFSADPAVNEYKPVSFNYTKVRFPQINLGVNDEDGLLVGLGFSRRTFGFRKEPFSTDQRLVTLYSPGQGAYQIRYNGVFNNVISKSDILVNAQVVNPTLNNFFGFGNESVYDKSKPILFYRVRYKYFETDILLRKRLSNAYEVSIGPSYFHYWSRYKDNDKRILSEPAVIGSDSASVYGVKQFLGVKAKFDINYVNSQIFPTRGILWYNEFSSMAGLNSNSTSLTKLTSDMTIYASLHDASRLGAVFRLGGGHIFSKNNEYFQSLSMGANNVLRGYRKNRFSGSSLLYASSELRLRLFKSKSYIVPGDVGMMGFFDAGKVWQRGMSSKKWHHAYGGGFYFIPYSLIMLSATIGFSPEDRLFNFSLGTKVRLVF
jgi:Omp85 superfamily domain/Calcineurin-like phosphoesterase